MLGHILNANCDLTFSACTENSRILIYVIGGRIKCDNKIKKKNKIKMRHELKNSECRNGEGILLGAFFL